MRNADHFGFVKIRFFSGWLDLRVFSIHHCYSTCQLLIKGQYNVNPNVVELRGKWMQSQGEWGAPMICDTCLEAAMLQ